MRKQHVGRKLHRKRDQRKALLKSLARSLVKHRKITTTEAKAKELRPFIERLVTKTRQKDVHAVRYAKKYFDDKTVHHLIHNVASSYQTRPGGYTRITKLPISRGSKGKMAIIEFV